MKIDKKAVVEIIKEFDYSIGLSPGDNKTDLLHLINALPTYTKEWIGDKAVIEQMFLNQFDCYADSNEPMPIPAMTIDAVLKLIESLQPPTK